MSLTVRRQKRRKKNLAKACRIEKKMRDRLEKKGWTTLEGAEMYFSVAREAGRSEEYILGLFGPSRVEIRANSRTKITAQSRPLLVSKLVMN